MKKLFILFAALIALLGLGAGTASADPPLPKPYNGGACPLGYFRAVATWHDDGTTHQQGVHTVHDGHYNYSGLGLLFLHDFVVNQPVVIDAETNPDHPLTVQVATANTYAHTRWIAYDVRISQDEAGSPSVHYDGLNYKPTGFTFNSFGFFFINDFGSVMTRVVICAGPGNANLPPEEPGEEFRGTNSEYHYLLRF